MQDGRHPTYHRPRAAARALARPDPTARLAGVGTISFLAAVMAVDLGRVLAPAAVWLYAAVAAGLG